jgi:hypothetical protein
VSGAGGAGKSPSCLVPGVCLCAWFPRLQGTSTSPDSGHFRLKLLKLPPWTSPQPGAVPGLVDHSQAEFATTGCPL